MEASRKSKTSINLEGVDRISNLPDPLVIAILSYLPTTKDAVRTGVLSKRWKDQWRFTSRITLDQKTMPSDEIQRYLQSTNFERRLDVGLKRAKTGKLGRNWDPIGAAAKWIERVIEGHSEPLTSVRIQHMMESMWEAEKWVKELFVEKKVRELYMERDVPNPKSSKRNKPYPVRMIHASDLKVPFEILASYHVIDLSNYHLLTPSPSSFNCPQNLKTIKLTHVMMRGDVGPFLSNCLSLENITLKQCMIGPKIKIHNSSVKVLNLERVNVSNIEVFAMNLKVLMLDSVFGQPQSLVLVIVAPNLKVLHCCYAQKSKGASELGFTHMRRILKDFCGAMTFEGSIYPSLFENLVSFYTDLNLRHEKDAALLSLVLESCHSLQNLDIKIDEVDERLHAMMHDHETNALNLRTNMLWRMMEYCKCISEKLKRVHIKGFKGKELELDFVKNLILVSEGIEDITIWFDDDCIWEEVTATMCLLSFPKNSANLSITLKPGEHYLASVGGTLQKWISTLNG